MPDRAPTDAETIQPEPATVGSYVRAKFPYWARRYLAILWIGAPMHAAFTAKQSNHSFGDMVLPLIGALALGTIATCVLLWVILSIGGWMKIKAKLPMWVPMLVLAIIIVASIYRAATY